MNKRQRLFWILSGIFISNTLIAEIIGAKIFSVEHLLGIAPAQIPVLGFKLDFNMSAGVLNWPLVFIISDIINEFYGVKGVKQISYLTAGLIAYSFLILFIATVLPAADFWVDLYKGKSLSHDFNIDTAFKLIFRQGMGIVIGSLSAFLLGQIVDAIIFKKLRQLTANKHIWIRATGSTLFSQFIDSFIVVFIAFYLFGNWPLTQTLAIGFINYIYKFGVALLITPAIYGIRMVIHRYLGRDLTHHLIEEATAESQR